MIVRYLTHPEVLQDADTDRHEWQLSDVGRARVEAFSTSGLLAGTSYIFCSAEKKARETAGIVGEALSIMPQASEDMNESDNMVSGFVAQETFKDYFKRFFSKPKEPVVDGWETAMDAQDRIAIAYNEAMERVVGTGMRGDVLMAGHGRVGTLLYCYLTGQAIGVEFTQPSPGHYFSYDWGAKAMLHGWKAMEEV
ncbi:histidine phosphatase family protein [uncultured Cohaesibacter sp.]|uniref:histidine phosphatase family protein n=1 Tax=uncultured Cohaesibacter sp. TaxID=1002546 RepID=UPI00292F7753|nr:histidine phosphatase family protein [uncultured Cohaesibacter sp.]